MRERVLQLAENPSEMSFRKGHDFSRAVERTSIDPALAAEVIPVDSHDASVGFVSGPPHSAVIQRFKKRLTSAAKAMFISGFITARLTCCSARLASQPHSRAGTKSQYLRYRSSRRKNPRGCNCRTAWSCFCRRTMNSR